MKNTTSYYLISTINAMINGWKIFGISDNKKDLEEKADKIWKGTDIYNDTYYKNHKVVSKTAAKKFGIK